MESVENKGEGKKAEEIVRQEIYSKAVRAGKRTYFFDVKSTRNDEYYLTITESKKKFSDKGQFHYEKHKIFLYREDFEKFLEGLEEVVNYIRDNQAEYLAKNSEGKETAVDGSESGKGLNDLDFENI
ncbi:MAG: PUR family DNA/RNA-binding protein [Bacteroidales bacterium]|nr:PUR family DNA/RNA-binding protein [Bacteroidales bacterium]